MRHRPHTHDRHRTDTELRAALVAGDLDAATELYRRYSDRVRRSSRSVLVDDALARDVTHDVFLELLRRPAAWDPGRSPLGAYLVLLARRRSIDLVRRTEAARRRDRWAGSASRTAVDDVPAAFESGDLSRSVRLAVGGLPPTQRAVVERAYFAGRSYRQVADDLGIPEGTAKTRLRVALATLRERPDLRARV